MRKEIKFHKIIYAVFNFFFENLLFAAILIKKTAPITLETAFQF